MTAKRKHMVRGRSAILTNRARSPLTWGGRERGIMRILTWLAVTVLAWCAPAQALGQVTMPDGSVIARDKVDSAAAACQAGKADACLVRGIALERGIGEPIEINLAAAAFR